MHKYLAGISVKPILCHSVDHISNEKVDSNVAANMIEVTVSEARGEVVFNVNLHSDISLRCKAKTTKCSILGVPL